MTANPNYSINHYLKSIIRYRIDESRCCEENGCDGICRCSRITSKEIVGVEGRALDAFLIKLHGLNKRGYRNTKYYTPTPIEAYCIERIFVSKGGYDLTLYNISVSNGYYGQEVSGIEHENLDDMKSLILEMLALESDHAKIMLALKCEYGYIADIIKETNKAEIVSMQLSAIEPSSGAKMMRKQRSYLYDLGKDDIIGVILGRLLIDGNHRFANSLSTMDESRKCRFVCLS